MDRPLHIGVVGAGTAGAAVAILFARAGHAVTVLERVPDPGPVGAGIIIQPTGQVVLARLGLLDAIRTEGARIDRLLCVRRGGRTVVDLAYAAVDPAIHGIGIHRGVLFQTLFAALRAEPRATVRCGVAVTATDVDGAGRWLVDGGGGRHGPFDLAIAADGAVSELHRAAPRVRSRPYPWGALWLVRDDPDGAFIRGAALDQVVDGGHHLLGILPTGNAPQSRTRVVSVFWSIRADRIEAWRAAGLDAWRADVRRLDPRADALLADLPDLAPVLFSRYHDVAMWPWHADRLVFLGDAAHATSPQLGQGANLALWDALVLSEVVAREPTVERALAAYSRARRRHLAYYQLATRTLTPLFQGDSRVLAWLRDRLFPTSRWLGPVHRRMVRTMCGIERGILRRPMPIAELRAQLPPPRPA